MLISIIRFSLKVRSIYIMMSVDVGSVFSVFLFCSLSVCIPLWYAASVPNTSSAVSTCTLVNPSVFVIVPFSSVSYTLCRLNFSILAWISFTTSAFAMASLLKYSLFHGWVFATESSSACWLSPSCCRCPLVTSRFPTRCSECHHIRALILSRM